MDRSYIENERIVERYLAGDLTVREARDFERYCLDHPDYLNSMPIPVRLKARLSRRPQDDSETGIFKAIPSSATRAAIETSYDGLERQEEERRPSGLGDAAGKLVVIALAVALLAALGGFVAYAMRANELSERIASMQRNAAATQMQAPGAVQRYRVQPVRAKPQEPTLVIGRPNPPQLLDLHIDASQGRYTQFLITIDRDDGTRVMQIRRIARDSNREVRLGLNTSAFGPGDYLLKIEGYNWRGQAEEVGWVRLGLQ